MALRVALPPAEDEALVPLGPPRRPRPSAAASLEAPDEARDGKVTAYPKELD